MLPTEICKPAEHDESDDQLHGDGARTVVFVDDEVDPEEERRQPDQAEQYDAHNPQPATGSVWSSEGFGASSLRGAPLLARIRVYLGGTSGFPSLARSP